MKWFGTDGRPSSQKNLYKMMQRESADMPRQKKRVYMQAMQNVVLSQFLDDRDFIKGGAALQLSYALNKARSSDDVDTVFSDSLDAFQNRLSASLEQGWEGFTGTIRRLEHGQHTLMPKGFGMTRYSVSLLYKGKPFSTFYMEAVPDINQCNRFALERTDTESLDAIRRLGFTPKGIRVMDPTYQLAEKLHAISRPGKIRGRDLNDILTIMDNERIDLDHLRRISDRIVANAGQHEIHVLDSRCEEAFREKFSEINSAYSFDEAWTRVNDILRQVDKTFTNTWMNTTDFNDWTEITYETKPWSHPAPPHGPQTRDIKGRYSHNAW